MQTQSIAALCLGLLLGCGTTNVDRYTAPAPPVAERISIRFDSIEIRAVTLPSYAAADEIHQQDEDGRLVSDTKVLWADSPERAVALGLARNLAKLTGARVASDPWPFEEFPQARLEIRFEDLLPQSNGELSAKGQYFVAVESGSERAGFFSLSQPFDPNQPPTDLARARSQLLLKLATFIARDGLR